MYRLWVRPCVRAGEASGDRGVLQGRRGVLQDGRAALCCSDRELGKT